MSIDAALERITEKLRRAREQGARPFGVDGHRWRMNPPMPPDAVAAAEARLGVTFPEEYRAFLTRVGDGGAGPAYGLFTLEKGLWEAEIWNDPDVLRIPFPHVADYNPETDPEVAAYLRRADQGEVSDAEVDLYLARQSAGMLPLCHKGCDYHHCLVVTGPTRGGMWMDGRAALCGFSPLNLTFLEWYERWLDDAVRGGPGTYGSVYADVADPREPGREGGGGPADPPA